MANTQVALKNALHESLIEGDSETANNLIEFFRIDLNYIDTDGRSFLYLAIEKKLKLIAQKLFLKQKADPNILFRTTNKGQTLFWAAAKAGYVEMFEQLLSEIKDKKSDEQGYQLWKTADQEGNTPLHVALAPGSQIITLVFKTLSEQMTKVTAFFFVNQKNKAGDTMFHIVMRQARLDLIPLILNAGGDWFGKTGESPFAIFCQHSIETQKNIVEAIAAFNKKNNYVHSFLEMYKRRLADNLSPEKVRQYYRLAGAISLKELAIAHLEFDSRIKRQDNHPIPKDILDLIPLYAERIGQSGTTLYQQTNANLQMLDSLMKKTNEYVNDLAKNSRTVGCGLQSICMVFLVWLIYFGIEFFLLYKAISEKVALNECVGYQSRWMVDHCYDAYRPAFGNSAFYGILGALLPMVASMTICDSVKKEKNISQKEWLPLINELKETVLQKIKQLSKEQSPTDDDTVMKLEQTMNDVQDNQPREQVKKYFEQINQLLTKLRRDVVATSRPFSIWKPITQVSKDKNPIQKQNSATFALLRIKASSHQQ
jgi:ankyrin repeat protein